MPSEWLKGAFIKGGKKMKILEGLVFLDPQIKRARIGYQDQAISILKIIQLHGSQLCQLTIFNVHDLTYHTQLMYIKNLGCGPSLYRCTDYTGIHTAGVNIVGLALYAGLAGQTRLRRTDFRLHLCAVHNLIANILNCN